MKFIIIFTLLIISVACIGQSVVSRKTAPRPAVDSFSNGRTIKVPEFIDTSYALKFTDSIGAIIRTTTDSSFYYRSKNKWIKIYQQ